jgi:hypothetical protein
MRGIVYEDMERPVQLQGPGDNVGPARFVARVEAEERSTGTERPACRRRRLTGRLVQLRDDDRGTFLRESLYRRATDTTAATRDDRNLVREPSQDPSLRVSLGVVAASGTNQAVAPRRRSPPRARSQPGLCRRA